MLNKRVEGHHRNRGGREFLQGRGVPGWPFWKGGCLESAKFKLAAKVPSFQLIVTGTPVSRRGLSIHS